MDEGGHIYAVAPREIPSTRQIVTPCSAPGKAARLVFDGWIIEIVGDAVFITCEGEVMTQTRTGGLNQKETVIRRDPPAGNHAKGTEIIGK
jgi:hypothetical protein